MSPRLKRAAIAALRRKGITFSSVAAAVRAARYAAGGAEPATIFVDYARLILVPDMPYEARCREYSELKRAARHFNVAILSRTLAVEEGVARAIVLATP